MESHKNVNWNFLFNEEEEIEIKIGIRWQFAKQRRRGGEKVG